VLNVKLKDIAPSYKWKKNYGRKVWTVNANDVKWVECEHVNKTGSIIQLETNINDWTYQLQLAKTDNQAQKQEIQTNLQNQENKLVKIMSERKFKLGPEQFTPILSLKLYNTDPKKPFGCKMKQIPANSNDATTGHKLQVMSKELLIVSSWPSSGLAAMFKNWEYVVLSRVQTLSGLYLVKPIDMEKSFKLSKELRSYIESARKKEKNMLERRLIEMSKYNWD
jgi:hypothetical protein